MSIIHILSKDILWYYYMFIWKKKKKSGDIKIAGCDNDVILSPSPKTTNKNKTNNTNIGSVYKKIIK